MTPGEELRSMALRTFARLPEHEIADVDPDVWEHLARNGVTLSVLLRIRQRAQEAAAMEALTCMLIVFTRRADSHGIETVEKLLDANAWHDVLTDPELKF
jgi:hypothetical protein